MDVCEVCRGLPGRWQTFTKPSGHSIRLFVCGWCLIMLDNDPERDGT